MPVSIQDLEEAQRPIEDRILEFLQSKPEQGYSSLEIASALEFPRGDESYLRMMLLLAPGDERKKVIEPYERALASLQKNRKVRSYQYRDLIYYAWNDEKAT